MPWFAMTAESDKGGWHCGPDCLIVFCVFDGGLIRVPLIMVPDKHSLLQSCGTIMQQRSSESREGIGQIILSCWWRRRRREQGTTGGWGRPKQRRGGWACRRGHCSCSYGGPARIRWPTCGHVRTQLWFGSIWLV